MATTNTQFSELQKLLINVAENKCDAFINAHINNTWPIQESEENPRPSELPEFTAGKNDAYYNKVVFLQKYNAIYTKGAFFGNTWDLIEDLKTGVTEKGITVKYDPDQNAIVTTVNAATYNTDTKTWGDDTIDNVVTGSTVKTYVDDKFKDAIAQAAAAMDFKGPIDSATNFKKIQNSANNGDVYVVTKTFTIGTVEEGNQELFEENDSIIFWIDKGIKKYTVIQKNLDNAVEKNPEWSGIIPDGVEKVALATGSNKIKPSDKTIGGATFADTGNSTILATEAGVISYVTGAIGALDMDHSVTTLTTVAGDDYLSVTENSGNDSDNDYNYTIGLNVVNLGDAVGMTYDETTGKWSAPEGSTAVNGLASAADVANELVSDEKVIAAALNDHEARIDALEDFVGDINGTIQDQLVIGDVTVDGLKAKVAEAGLVNTQLLVDVINALDPWEDYE
jgi:hypothetical protein